MAFLTAALALSSCSKGVIQEETGERIPVVERAAEVAPGSLKIVVTPEATGAAPVVVRSCRLSDEIDADICICGRFPLSLIGERSPLALRTN